MAANVFSDTDFCLTCEKPLRGGDSFYCDDVCRAQDGAGKPEPHHFHYGSRPGDSPSILASLPPLIASHVHAQAIARQRSSQGASASNSSHSETSSPLQSPSPLAGQPITTMEGSPREDMFLPPPAFPNAHPYLTANPVKIPASYKASPPVAPYGSQTGSFKGEPATATATAVADSTLHYGRRPGQTNSMTSPLALFPVGANRRRDSKGEGIKPKLSALSPALKAMSPAFKAQRIVSEPVPERDHHSAQQAAHTKPAFQYGMHSPLFMAANRRPSSTSNIDYTEAKPQQSPSSQALELTKASSQQYRPRSTDVYGYAGVQVRPTPRAPEYYDSSSASSLSERRRSFPAHLIGGSRPALAPLAPVQRTQELFLDESDDQVVGSPVRRGRSREKREGAVERECSRHRDGSSRSSGSRRDGRSATVGRMGRSGSRRGRREDSGRGGAEDLERTVGPRDTSRLGVVPMPPSPPRGVTAAIPGAVPTSSSSASTAKLIAPQPTAARAIGAGDHVRNTFLGRDLSTIMASYQQPGAVQPRFAQEDKDDISEALEEDDLDSGRRGRGRAPRDHSKSPKDGQKGRGVNTESRRDQQEKDSQAAKELKRLFEEGVPVA